MATKTKASTKSAPVAGDRSFTPTFRKYESMTPGEQEAFKQGCKTVGNKIKENLGLKRRKVS